MSYSRCLLKRFVRNMRINRAAVIAILALTAVTPTAVHAQWAVPPANYAYAQLSVCPQTYVRYLACDDQMARFSAALAKAREGKRKLLVVFGADWCPWCQTIDKNVMAAEYLNHPDLIDKFEVVKIALNVLQNSRKVIVPSGQAVLDLVSANIRPDKPEGYIPFYAIVDPDENRLTIGFSNGRFAEEVDGEPTNIAPAFRRAMSSSLDVFGRFQYFSKQLSPVQKP